MNFWLSKNLFNNSFVHLDPRICAFCEMSWCRSIWVDPDYSTYHWVRSIWSGRWFIESSTPKNVTSTPNVLKSWVLVKRFFAPEGVIGKEGRACKYPPFFLSKPPPPKRPITSMPYCVSGGRKEGLCLCLPLSRSLSLPKRPMSLPFMFWCPQENWIAARVRPGGWGMDRLKRLCGIIHILHLHWVERRRYPKWTQQFW